MIDHRYSPRDDRAASNALVRRARKRVLDATGAVFSYTPPREDVLARGRHACGWAPIRRPRRSTRTAGFAASPTCGSPTAARCRCRPGVNPSLTIAANALRAGDAIVEARVIALAFLGTGAIARAHASRLRRHRDVELAFASREPRARRGDRARAAAATRVSRATTPRSPPPEVDVVAIVTPPRFARRARAARAGGRQARRAREAARCRAPPIVDRGRRRRRARPSRRVFVAENYHYKPVLARLRGLLADRRDRRCAVHPGQRDQAAGDATGWRERATARSTRAASTGSISWPKLGDGRAACAAAPRPGHRPRVERSMLVTFDYAERRGRHAVVLVGGAVDRARPAAVEDLRPRRHDHVRDQRPVGAVPRHEDAALRPRAARSRRLSRDVGRLRATRGATIASRDDARPRPARPRARRAGLRDSRQEPHERRDRHPDRRARRPPHLDLGHVQGRARTRASPGRSTSARRRRRAARRASPSSSCTGTCPTPGDAASSTGA